MEELLNEIDELLAHHEDFSHGEEGYAITKMRGKIALALRQYRETGEICAHENTYIVAGVFGGEYCSDCDEKITP